MTTIAASPLTHALQTLVDARLDTIDRMLLGRVNRQDRLAIVREVETQIFDLMEGRETGSLDRDDVLAVLARLDPPEAYLPDEDSGEIRMTAPRRPMVLRAIGQPQTRTGTISGILGIVSMVMIVFIVLSWLAAGSVGEKFAIMMIATSTGITFLTSLLAVVFAARVRLRGGWAITGLVTGVVALLISCLGTFLLAAELV